MAYILRLSRFYLKGIDQRQHLQYCVLVYEMGRQVGQCHYLRLSQLCESGCTLICSLKATCINELIVTL